MSVHACRMSHGQLTIIDVDLEARPSKHANLSQIGIDAGRVAIRVRTLLDLCSLSLTDDIARGVGSGSSDRSKRIVACQGAVSKAISCALCLTHGYQPLASLARSTWVVSDGSFRATTSLSSLMA